MMPLVDAEAVRALVMTGEGAWAVGTWIAGLFTVIDRAAMPVPAEFVAERVTAKLPGAVGVPEINPELVFTESPEGRPVAL
jgi:hypothetical protein